MKKEYENIVTIIGRPNVGKSTLFNRLVGQRIAIEAPVSGTTRDQLIGHAEWLGKKFVLIDVAGIENFDMKNELHQNTQASINEAISISDLIIFCVDWTQKDNDQDKQIARMLRRSKKKTILVANKADNINRINDTDEFSRHGFPVFAVSAINGKNTGDLMDAIISNLKFTVLDVKEKPEDELDLAIIGRPNVGKSTLLNTIVGEKRAVVSDVPGTTRDAVNINFQLKGRMIKITDTAGIRRSGKIDWDSVEKFSVMRTYRAIRDCDVAILMIDATEGLVANDAHILGYAKECGKGIVLAVNKTDLWSNKEYKMSEMISLLQTKLNFAPWLPVVFISAQDNENVEQLLKQVVVAEKNRETVIPGEDLKKILEFMKSRNPQLADVQSIYQAVGKPPTFNVKISGKKDLHKSQEHYIENKIRDVYPMDGTPIFIDLFIRGKRK